jgi:hypothetical protein
VGSRPGVDGGRGKGQQPSHQSSVAHRDDCLGVGLQLFEIEPIPALRSARVARNFQCALVIRADATKDRERGWVATIATIARRDLQAKVHHDQGKAESEDSSAKQRGPASMIYQCPEKLNMEINKPTR